MTIAEQVIRLKTDFDEVYEAGKQAEYDAFWRSYMKDGMRKDLDFAFAGRGWNDDTFTYEECIRGTSMFSVFRNSNVSFIPSVSFEDTTDASYAFSGCSNLITIEEIYFSTQYTPEEMNYTYAFHSCGNLMNITPLGDIGSTLDLKSCRKLTADSAFSLIDCLCNLSTEWDDDWYGACSFLLHRDVWGRVNAEYTDYEAYGYSDWQEYISAELGWET